MMEMLKMLTREKQSVEVPNLQTQTTPLRGIGEDTPYPQGFALPRETSAIYASPSTAYPFNYRPPQATKTPGPALHELKIGTDPVDPLTVPDLDELTEKGKSLQDKALEKYELLEEIIRAMEGISIPKSIDAT